ncbi:hypothetical protein V9L05_17880 [Bernardetia sp. Wsw4-3y2]
MWCTIHYAGLGITFTEFYSLEFKRMTRILAWLNNQKAKELADSKS